MVVYATFEIKISGNGSRKKVFAVLGLYGCFGPNSGMKKIWGALVIILNSHMFLAAQPGSSLPARVDSILQITGRLDYEKIMDYTYPRLFTIVSRAEMISAVRQSFETEEYSAGIDSLKLLKIHPVFTVSNASYAKVTHSMVMRMKFKEGIDSSSAPDIIALLEPEFGKGNVRFENSSGSFVIKMLSDLIAIKDEYAKEWSFVNFEKDSPLIGLLFSKEVIEKLDQLK